jgi:type II secretory ATPase GspE/PulE/Tfp pilus assembly ATPase PilB-like protein
VDSEASYAGSYVDYPNYSREEWAEATEREKFESRKRAMGLLLKNQLLGTTWTTNTEGERVVLATQAYVVRDDKPIAVEVTDQDLSDLHLHRKTPQAVIRRINKVRDTLDKFPAKLV